MYICCCVFLIAFKIVPLSWYKGVSDCASAKQSCAFFRFSSPCCPPARLSEVSEHCWLYWLWIWAIWEFIWLYWFWYDWSWVCKLAKAWAFCAAACCCNICELFGVCIIGVGNVTVGVTMLGWTISWFWTWLVGGTFLEVVGWVFTTFEGVVVVAVLVTPPPNFVLEKAWGCGGLDCPTIVWSQLAAKNIIQKVIAIFFI